MLQSTNENNESEFSFWDELCLKAGCLHFLSSFVNEHQWDITVMMQGQGESYPSDLGKC